MARAYSPFIMFRGARFGIFFPNMNGRKLMGSFCRDDINPEQINDQNRDELSPQNIIFEAFAFVYIY